MVDLLFILIKVGEIANAVSPFCFVKSLRISTTFVAGCGIYKTKNIFLFYEKWLHFSFELI